MNYSVNYTVISVNYSFVNHRGLVNHTRQTEVLGMGWPAAGRTELHGYRLPVIRTKSGLAGGSGALVSKGSIGLIQ